MAGLTRHRSASVAMPGSARLVVVLWEEALFFLYFILKRGFCSSAIWYFEGNNYSVCPDFGCCFRKTVVLVINSWYKECCVQKQRLIRGTETERSRTTYALMYLLEFTTVWCCLFFLSLFCPDQCNLQDVNAKASVFNGQKYFHVSPAHLAALCTGQPRQLDSKMK